MAPVADAGRCPYTKFEVRRPCRSEDMAHDVCDLDICPFDLETGMLVASKVKNLQSKFEHARPLGSRAIRYVRDGRTDRRTDKSNVYCPLPYGRGHNSIKLVN